MGVVSTQDHGPGKPKTEKGKPVSGESVSSNFLFLDDTRKKKPQKGRIKSGSI